MGGVLRSGVGAVMTAAGAGFWLSAGLGAPAPALPAATAEVQLAAVDAPLISRQLGTACADLLCLVGAGSSAPGVSAATSASYRFRCSARR